MNIVKAILSGISGSCQSSAKPTSHKSRIDEPVFMRLSEAQKDQEMRREMLAQLKIAKLTIGSGEDYVAGVIFKGTQYYIMGRRDDWECFFGRAPVRHHGQETADLSFDNSEKKHP
jgi:hypothetical protein